MTHFTSALTSETIPLFARSPLIRKQTVSDVFLSLYTDENNTLLRRRRAWVEIAQLNILIFDNSPASMELTHSMACAAPRGLLSAQRTISCFIHPSLRMADSYRTTGTLLMGGIYQHSELLLL